MHVGISSYPVLVSAAEMNLINAILWRLLLFSEKPVRTRYSYCARGFWS